MNYMILVKKPWILITAAIIVAGLAYLLLNKSTTYNSTTPADSSNVMMDEAEAPTSSPSGMMMMSNDVLMSKENASGEYLADPKGMTLYSYDKDTRGVSNCYGQCEAVWPIYNPGKEAPVSLPDDVTVVKRTDGTLIYAYKGMPLYYYASDAKAGDVTGDGVGGVWHLVKP